MVLSLPFQPVCRPDCPGLDPVTGERLADLGEVTPREVLDPRWAALSGFQGAGTDAERVGTDDSTPHQSPEGDGRTA